MSELSSNVALSKPPLGEAWLEIRWKLTQSTPGMQEDRDFAFALGTFYALVNRRYPHRVDLDVSKVPPVLAPYIVRHQFWAGDGRWPILQLGPGVATVNFTHPYSWTLFAAEAAYLREQLLAAYSNALPPLDLIVLRYLNAEPFDFTTADVVEFLRENLNTSISMHSGLPGTRASKPYPTSLNLKLTYDNTDPRGTGTITIGTAARALHPAGLGQPTRTNAAIWQLEFASGGDDTPELGNEHSFTLWLEEAHSVLHTWFFSLIEGPLERLYMQP